MKNKKPVYSWDTSIVIAWLKNEQDKPLAALRLVIDDIEKGKAGLILSVLVLTELLTVELPDGSGIATQRRAEFVEWTRRPNVEWADVTEAIANRGAEIRTFWKTHKNPDCKQNQNIKTPDALIVATAAEHQVTMLHAWSDKAFLRLDKLAIVNHIAIKPPQLISGQKPLFPDDE